MSDKSRFLRVPVEPFTIHPDATADDILTRMQAHQRKKSSMLRELKLARRFLKT